VTLRPALFTVLLAGLGCGQDAQLSGLIRDPSQAAVAGAEITLRSDQSGGRRTTHSSESGLYNLTNLRPGLYRLTVRAPGFETVVREGLEFQIGETARLDFDLRIGDSQTIITVTGSTPLVNQDDASVGTVIDRNLIDRMPLNGRGIQTLIELTPGVLAMPVIDSSRGQFVINGQRTDANYYTVDGVSANFAAGNSRGVYSASFPTTIGQAGGGMLPANNFLGTFSNLLSPDALQEFKIQTSTYAPEFGHLPGGQIDLISRSGANRFSGSLFEYFRNDKADANDWFLNSTGATRSPLRFNNFGATLSGPLRRPRVAGGRGGDPRLFFFLSIDELVAREPLPPVHLGVPSLAARQTVPPGVAALFSAYPLPPANGGPAVVDAATRRYDQHAYSLRVDQYFGQNVSFFGRYNHAPSSRAEPTRSGMPSNAEHYDIGTDSLTVGITQAIAPNFINDFRGNFSRQSTEDRAELDGRGGARQPPASLLFPAGYSFSDSTFQFTVAGSPSVYLGTYARNGSRQFQAVDNVSWARGAHRLRFGADYRAFFTRRTNSKLGNLPVVLSILNGNAFLIGPGWSMMTYVDNDIEYLVPSSGAYAQDTWRLSRRLTVTWGVRWEVNPAPRTTRGAALVAGGLTNLNDASGAYLLSPGQPFYPTSWTNFAPRIGAGWQILERAGKPTVLRAGFGRFFSSAEAGFEDYARGREILTSYGSGPLPDLLHPVQMQTIDPLFAVAAPRGYNLPSTYQWNVTLEQAIGRQTVSAGYVGARGRHLIGDIAMLPTALDFSIHVIGNNASSSYHAMQLQLKRRLTNRLQVLTSYTWSHSIDNLSNDLSPANIKRTPAEYLNPDADRGPSDFDVRHSLNSAVIAELPGPRSRGFAALLRNWRANSIFFARSSLPTDVIGLLYGPHHIDYIAGQPLYLYGQQYPGGKRYNPGAFAEVGPNQTGTLGRNVLRGFPAWQIDFALHRQIPVAEHINLEFRAEAFNILNHPNFANPSDARYLNSIALRPTPQFGVATAMLANGLSPALIPGELNPLFQIGGSRIIQLALRLKF
jgi:hypothetical protein